MNEVSPFDRWLLAACILFGLFGLSWAVLGSFDPFGLWDRQLADAFYGGATPAEVVRFRRFILGPFGATVAGYYLAVGLIVRYPFRRREPWAFGAVAGAIGLWFLVDTAASIAHGAWFNVVLVNLPCLLVFSIPLAALFPRFRSGS